MLLRLKLSLLAVFKHSANMWALVGPGLAACWGIPWQEVSGTSGSIEAGVVPEALEAQDLPVLV